MSTPDPAHIDAVARMLYLALPDPDVHCWDDLDGFARSHYRTQALAFLDSDNPAVHAAMLDALTRHGVLTKDTRTRLDGYGGMVDTGTGAGPMVIARAATNERRLVTSWEVTP